MYEDENYQSKISKYLRFYTNKSENNLVSLDSYLSNRLKNQKDIYLEAKVILNKLATKMIC